MKVFATNYFETMIDDVDGGKNWNSIIDGNRGTGRGRPTNTKEITRNGSYQNMDNDTANESSNFVGGAMVA